MRRRVQIEFDAESNRTHGEFRQECNINNIMKKYQRSGFVDHVAKHGPRYGEFPAMDFREALEFLQESQEMFDELPSEVRREFDNDPAAFLEYVQDPANMERLGEWGFLDEPPATAPDLPVGSNPSESLKQTIGDAPPEGG